MNVHTARRLAEEFAWDVGLQSPAADKAGVRIEWLTKQLARWLRRESIAYHKRALTAARNRGNK